MARAPARLSPRLPSTTHEIRSLDFAYGRSPYQCGPLWAYGRCSSVARGCTRGSGYCVKSYWRNRGYTRGLRYYLNTYYRGPSYACGSFWCQGSSALGRGWSLGAGWRHGLSSSCGGRYGRLLRCSLSGHAGRFSPLPRYGAWSSLLGAHFSSPAGYSAVILNSCTGCWSAGSRSFGPFQSASWLWCAGRPYLSYCLASFCIVGRN